MKEAEQGDDYIEYPSLPLKYVCIDDFEYRGLNKNSSFNDVIKTLGEKKIKEIPIEDTSYFALRYKVDGMVFEFSGSDKHASDGLSFCIIPD